MKMSRSREWLPVGYAQASPTGGIALTIVYLIKDDSACRFATAATVNGIVDLVA